MRCAQRSLLIPGGMASTEYLVAGLGNPGSAYVGTPHNAGFAVIERLAAIAGGKLRRSWRFRAFLGRVNLAGVEVGLMQPRTYMNRSGDAVAPWMRYHRLSSERLLVIVDDIDRPLGSLRIRGSGGSGGHKGLRSIIEHMGTENFPRLRIGVGRGTKGGDVVRHVLTPFSRAENDCFRKMLDLATQSVCCMLEEGLETAMNRFNGSRIVGEDRAT